MNLIWLYINHNVNIYCNWLNVFFLILNLCLFNDDANSSQDTVLIGLVNNALEKDMEEISCDII